MGKATCKTKTKKICGVDPKIWGPSLWKTLHIISFNYPINPTKKTKTIHLKFIKNLKYLLPCKSCRENLCQHFSTDPITMKTMKNRYTFSHYIYNLHENINIMLGKKSNITYENAKKMYENENETTLNGGEKYLDFFIKENVSDKRKQKAKKLASRYTKKH